MFIWTGEREAHVEPLCAHDNKSLGSALRHELENYEDWYEVEFWFL